jgi:hypothetical protein
LIPAIRRGTENNRFRRAFLLYESVIQLSGPHTGIAHQEKLAPDFLEPVSRGGISIASHDWVSRSRLALLRR